MNPGLINALIVAALTSSVVLIATKHQMLSIVTSLLATLLIILTLIPSEAVHDDEVYQYSPGGGVTVGPRKAKSPRKSKPRKPKLTPGKSGPTLPTLKVAPKPTDSLPTCGDPPLPPSDSEMRDHIRNHGLYGIHGNLSCKRLQRGTVGDKGMLQPLNARNQMIKFLSVDQLHAKDPHLIPRNTAQA
jgi:hypothetical protein